MYIVLICPAEVKVFYVMGVFFKGHFSHGFGESYPTVFKFDKVRFGSSDLRALSEFVTPCLEAHPYLPVEICKCNKT